MISALTTGTSSSVKATAPPSTRPPISASSAPLAALGDAAHGENVGVAGPLGLQVDELGGRLMIDGRLGVGHAGDGRDAAAHRRGRAGRDRLVFLAARLAQVHVHVDEARADDHSRGVDGAVGRRAGRADDLAVVNPQVGDAVEILRGIDEPAVGDAKKGHAAIVAAAVRSGGFFAVGQLGAQFRQLGLGGAHPLLCSGH